MSKYNNLSLPIKNAHISPTEIAKFLSPIESFEGPIHAKVMIPNARLYKELGRQGPVLVLLSDMHDGDKKCDRICDPKAGCYSLYNPSTFIRFVDTLAKQHSISVDVFLELWLPEKERADYRAESKYNSPLADVLLEAAPCTSRTAKCPFPHVRTHLSDPRIVDPKSKYNAEAIFSTLKFAVNIKEYPEGLELLYPGFGGTYLISLMSRMCTSSYTMHDFVSEPFFQKYSRTYHEFAQLPKKIQSSFLKQSNKYLKQIPAHHKLRSELFFKNLIHEGFYDSNTNPVQFEVESIPIYAQLVDIYTISRAIKLFRGGLDSQLSVMYFGDSHTKGISTLIERYYQTSKTYGREGQFSSFDRLEDIKLPPKCIQQIKACSCKRARKNELTLKAAKKVASDYDISTKGKKGDICKRLISNDLAFERS